MQTSVIIPTLNEADSIAQVLNAIPHQQEIEVLVVDGGSTDSTPQIAEAQGAAVLYEPRRGYGRACATGAAAARGTVIAFMDADGADDPTHLPELIAPIQAAQADLVLGSRLAKSIDPRAMPWHQRVGNRLSAALIRRLYRLHITDLSPMRAVTRSKLLALDLQEMTYGYPTEMIVKAARMGWRIQEVPVNYRPRLGGQSKISGTLRGTVFATYHILRIILRYAYSKQDVGGQA